MSCGWNNIKAITCVSDNFNEFRDGRPPLLLPSFLPFLHFSFGARPLFFRSWQQPLTMSVIFRRHGQGKATPVIITSTSETFYCTRHFCRRPSAFTSRKAFHDHTTILSSSTFTHICHFTANSCARLEAPLQCRGIRQRPGQFQRAGDINDEKVLRSRLRSAYNNSVRVCEAGWSSASAVAAALPLHLTRCRARGSMAASKGCVGRCLC